MAYTELIKNFERIRGYMKEFYVYGFRTRSDVNQKSNRSYDNEKRRIESYLGEYTGFHQNSDGKTVFLSIDSRNTSANPLYNAFKAKSFTNMDITLHFIILDILYKPDVSLTVNEIADIIDEEYLSQFEGSLIFDISSLRKKLKEYEKLGLLRSKKVGRQLYYQRTDTQDVNALFDALSFFSEVEGCGVIGSYLRDRCDDEKSNFIFKHHYITGTLDSEIALELLTAIYNKQAVEFEYKVKGTTETIMLTPIKVYVSSRNGRQYLFGFVHKYNQIKVFRLDHIVSVNKIGTADDFELASEQFDKMKEHLWGVSLGDGKTIEHVEFTVHMNDGEEHIYRRLLREKRIGTVERIDKNTCLYKADVFDTQELVPWIRTYICRITKLNFSNRSVENRFKQDIEDMYRLYDVGGER